MLRQVALAEDSEETGDAKMIYFSLFAQKRIEVKPGKEILLAVATPDGKFLDTPVIFTGRLSGEDADVNTSYESTELHSASTGPRTLPPKMRKTWSKRSYVQSRTFTRLMFYGVPSQTLLVQLPRAPLLVYTHPWVFKQTPLVVKIR